eukprot:368699_1
MNISINKNAVLSPISVKTQHVKCTFFFSNQIFRRHVHMLSSQIFDSQLSLRSFNVFRRQQQTRENGLFGDIFMIEFLVTDPKCLDSIQGCFVTLVVFLDGDREHVVHHIQQR